MALTRFEGVRAQERLDLSEVIGFWKSGSTAGEHSVTCNLRGGGSTKLSFDTETNLRNAIAMLSGVSFDHNRLSPIQKRKTMFKDLFGDLRGYLKENRDLVFTVCLVLVLDHVVFEGAFRERVKALVEGLLKKHETPTTVV